MTHIMVPDGVLAPWVWVGGWLAAVAGIAYALWATRDTDRPRLVPLAAVLAGVMTLVMSLEIVPLAYEPHLTALSGIVLGPAYAFLAVFVFNVLRMLIGDGAPTLLGLNTVLLGLEAILAYYAFRGLARVFSARGPASAGFVAALATGLALAVATLVFLAVVALGSTNLAEVGEEIVEALGMEDPAFSAYATAVLGLGAIGWLLESVVVGAIVTFLRAVRPALVPVASSAAAERAGTAPARGTQIV
jgi:cobalt/nickel transport system permease protein